MKAINKKKLMFILPLLAVALTFAFATPAYAQDGTPPTAEQERAVSALRTAAGSADRVPRTGGRLSRRHVGIAMGECIWSIRSRTSCR